MPHADRRERARELGALGRCGDGEALAQPAAARVDAQLATGLGIDEVEEPDVRELLLARIADLDRDDVVVPGELEQRPSPVALAAEVGDDDDERALARERARARERGRERASRPGRPPAARCAAPRAARRGRRAPASAGSRATPRRRTSRRRGGCRAGSRGGRSRRRRPRRRPPCADRPCRTASRRRCRARAT